MLTTLWYKAWKATFHSSVSDWSLYISQIFVHNKWRHSSSYVSSSCCHLLSFISYRTVNIPSTVVYSLRYEHRNRSCGRASLGISWEIHPQKLPSSKHKQAKSLLTNQLEWALLWIMGKKVGKRRTYCHRGKRFFFTQSLVQKLVACCVTLVTFCFS